MSEDIYWTTVVLGKAEEMERNFYSLKHHIDISVKKVVFINTITGTCLDGKDNVEVFQRHRNPGDRCFLCHGNYWTTPYRYAIQKVIPQNIQFSVYTESDIWLEKKTTFFTRGIGQLNGHSDVGAVSMLTRYLTPELEQSLLPFDKYVILPKQWRGAQFLWHFVILNNQILRDYYGLHKRELSDGNIAKYCRKRNMMILVEDGRQSCVHFDSTATAKKYPIYQQYYQTQSPERQRQTRKEFSSRWRTFNKTCFTEI